LQKEIIIRSAGEGHERRERESSTLLSRFFFFLLLLILCFHLSVPANAYSVVHIQASIDLATWEIVTGVVRDEVGLTASSPEWKRMDKDVLDELIRYEYNSLDRIDEGKVATRDKSVAHSGLVSGLANLGHSIGIGAEENRVLTFPTNQTNRNSSTSTDMESALNANNAIVFDLNQAFKIYCERNNITKTPDATAMLTAMKGFISSTAPSSGDYITYFSDSTGSDTTQYRWRVDKYTGSTEKITWSMLIVEAFTNFSLEGEEAVDADNVYSGNPNQLTKAVVGLFSDILDSLRSILGLWSMDELLFNEGWRSTGYVGGIFPTSWEPTVWALFMFTEIIAAMIVLVGIIMCVLKQAAATMNTVARIHAMSQIQDMLVCGLALALLPLALRMVIALSGNLVSIISAIRPESLETGNPKTVQEMVRRFSSGNGTFGGIIAQFLFFGAQVYFNFFYALRALSTAVLIIMAPMMISFITVSSAKKQVTMTWLKELLANILVQPIHTFCVTVILLLPTSTHGFDNLIAIYALIPFTAMIRSLFFGPAGGFVDQAANRGTAITNGAIAGGITRTASRVYPGVLALKERLMGDGSKDNEGGSDDGGSSGAGGNAGGTNTDLNNASAEKNSNNSGTGNPGSGTQPGGTNTTPNDENGGPDGGSGNNGSTGGSGDSGSDTTASSIANAQNGPASSSPSQPSPQGQGGGSAVPKPSMKERWNAFKNSKPGKAIGSGLNGFGAFAGGLALNGIGGALTGAGLQYIGAPISSAGDTLIAGRGQRRKDEDQNKDPNQRGESDKKENLPDTSQSGTDIDLSKQTNQPVNLGSVGKRRANDSSGDQEMQVRDLNQKELDKQGFSDIEDDFKTLEFTASGESPQAKELGAYADYLKTLPPDQRRKEVNDRGIEATRTDDGIQVRIDKKKWSKANDGARISSWTNAKTGDATMRIKSPEGSKTPSLTGAAIREGVNPVSVPKAQHASVSIGKNGQEITRAFDVQQKMLDGGFSNTAALRASERVGAIRELQERGRTPEEAAKLSKKMVSGIKREEGISIPKAELSPAQAETMVQAVQAGKAYGTPSTYCVKYDCGTEPPTFGPEQQETTSFSNLMNNPQSVPNTAPASSHAPTGPVSAVNAEPSPGHAAAGTAYTPSPVGTSAERTPKTPGSPSMPAPATLETTGVPIRTPPRINPALAQRAATYKSVKQSTGSAEQAFAATKTLSPPPAPAPAPTQTARPAPASVPSIETTNVSMGRPDSTHGSAAPPVRESKAPAASVKGPRSDTSRTTREEQKPVTQPESPDPFMGEPSIYDFGISLEDEFAEPLSPEEQQALNEALGNNLFDDA